MNLTKPAGVLMQLMGACFAFVGMAGPILLFVEDARGGGLVLTGLLVLGIWMLKEGRKPSVEAALARRGRG